MRLIDVDALLRCIPNEDITSRFDVKNASTIDAETVIKCKDCKHCKHWICTMFDKITYETFFCAYGEKMDEVNDE